MLKDITNAQFWHERCRSCTSWEPKPEFKQWGNCTEPELNVWLIIPIPDFFGCLWWQPKLSDTMKKLQIKLPPVKKGK